MVVLIEYDGDSIGYSIVRPNEDGSLDETLLLVQIWLLLVTVLVQVNYLVWLYKMMARYLSVAISMSTTVIQLAIGSLMLEH